MKKLEFSSLTPRNECRNCRRMIAFHVRGVGEGSGTESAVSGLGWSLEGMVSGALCIEMTSGITRGSLGTWGWHCWQRGHMGSPGLCDRNVP